MTGDRNWYAPDLAEEVMNRLLSRYGPGLVIVPSAATGIDRSFVLACGDLGVEQKAHPARESVTTLVQGLTNARHNLEVVADGDGAVPVPAIRVYKPPVK